MGVVKIMMPAMRAMVAHSRIEDRLHVLPAIVITAAASSSLLAIGMVVVMSTFIVRATNVPRWIYLDAGVLEYVRRHGQFIEKS
jgi:hypothetical protein